MIYNNKNIIPQISCKYSFQLFAWRSLITLSCFHLQNWLKPSENQFSNFRANFEQNLKTWGFKKVNIKKDTNKALSSLGAHDKQTWAKKKKPKKVSEKIGFLLLWH